MRTPSAQKARTLAKIYNESPIKSSSSSSNLGKFFGSIGLANDQRSDRTKKKFLIRSSFEQNENNNHSQLQHNFKQNNNKKNDLEASIINNLSVPMVNEIRKERFYSECDRIHRKLESIISPKIETLRMKETLTELKYFISLKEIMNEAFSSVFSKENIITKVLDEFEELFLKVLKKNHKMAPSKVDYSANSKIPFKVVNIANLANDEKLRNKLQDCMNTLSEIKNANVPLDKIFNFPVADRIDLLLGERKPQEVQQNSAYNSLIRKEKSPFKIDIESMKKIQSSGGQNRDFQDEFWSKIDEFSQSWRDAGEKERKI